MISSSTKSITDVDNASTKKSNFAGQAGHCNTFSSTTAGPLILRTRRVLRACPLQHMQMTAFSSIPAGHPIPRTRRVLRACPLQHMQMTTFSSTIAGALIPRTRRVLRS